MDATALLAEAARYRRLAKAINDESVVRQYEAYARELEQRAAEMRSGGDELAGHGVVGQLLRHRGGALVVAAGLAVAGWLVLLGAAQLVWRLFRA